MTIPQIECYLCASLLDNPTAKLGPKTCTALAFADFWESPEAAKVVRGINDAIRKRRPTHRVVVGLLMEQEYREWLKHPVFNEGLPMSCVESLVDPMLTHYQNKRLVQMIGDAYHRANGQPDKARSVARNLVAELERSRFFVESESRPDISHIVDMDWRDERWQRPRGMCGCEEMQCKNKRACKHLFAVVDYLKTL